MVPRDGWKDYRLLKRWDETSTVDSADGCATVRLRRASRVGGGARATYICSAYTSSNQHLRCSGQQVGVIGPGRLFLSTVSENSWCAYQLG